MQVTNSARTVWRAMLAACLLAAPAAAKDASDVGQGPAPAVVDLSHSWRFRSVERLYMVDRRPVLCIEAEGHRYRLWDPDGARYLSEPQSRCAPLPGSVDTPLPYRKFAQDAPAEAESPSPAIYVADDQPTHCRANFGESYLARIGGRTGRFFILGRLKSPRAHDIEAPCEAAPDHLAQSIDTVEGLYFIPLPSGAILAFSYDADLRQPVLIRLQAIPADSWNASGEIFIIPAPSVEDQLNSAGGLAARYRVMRRAVDATKPQLIRK